MSMSMSHGTDCLNQLRKTGHERTTHASTSDLWKRPKVEALAEDRVAEACSAVCLRKWICILVGARTWLVGIYYICVIALVIKRETCEIHAGQNRVRLGLFFVAPWLQPPRESIRMWGDYLVQAHTISPYYGIVLIFWYSLALELDSAHKALPLPRPTAPLN
ncbi:hypothetical protein GQ44DRAFT_457593 [Phaeosphaeriaceae sp. PMI808]|nr:hypothetical protein GQ44DRAFT_457593 [Phaeosphaeriaceae sp. PMI808]